jgi:hypothetical protein
MSNFWNGAKQEAEVEVGGGFDPMPAGTTLLANITAVKWNSANPNSSFFDPSEPEFIELEWTAIQGEFTGRKVFQKLRVLVDDVKKSSKAKDILATIDLHCGGTLFQSPEIPSDQSLAVALVGKAPMNIKLEVWEKEDKTPGGNWVCNVSGNAPQQMQQQQQPVQQMQQQPAQNDFAGQAVQQVQQQQQQQQQQQPMQQSQGNQAPVQF